MKIKKYFYIFLSLFLSVNLYSLPNFSDEETKQELKEDIKYFTDNSMLGRETGSDGEKRANEYLKEKLESFGFVPYFGDSFVQSYSLNHFLPNVPNIEFGGRKLEHNQDFLFTSLLERENTFSIDENNVIFVGFGISSQYPPWDDFKNISVKDKIIIMRGGVPFFLEEETYYSSFWFKVEEAKRRGAKGLIFISAVDDASWEQTKITYANTYYSNGMFSLPEPNHQSLQFWAIIRKNILEKILEKHGTNLDALYTHSTSSEFKPQDLNVNFQISGPNQHEVIETGNVVAVTPKVSKKIIVVTAHTDHIGYRVDPNTGEMKIFSGAIDNASAVAAMIALAKKTMTVAKDFNYSVVFAGVTGEERGLLGSRYLVSQLDKENVIANINLEVTPVWGKSKGIVAIGGEFSKLGDYIHEIATNENLTYGTQYETTERSIFYRSDQFNFNRYGIPGVWLTTSSNFLSGRNHFQEYMDTAYHTERDVFQESWEFDSTLQVINTAFELIRSLQKTNGILPMRDKLPFPIEVSAKL